MKTMKQLIDLYLRDIREENFSVRDLIVYGLTGTASIIGLCILSEIINAL